jgi:hypothetical protein
LPGLGAIPGANPTVIMPALGGVQVIGPNGGVSNNLMLPSQGLTNFVPDPSSLVSTNYFGMPAPNGMPQIGPGTTNYPMIPGYGNQSNAAPASGHNAPFESITRPHVNSNPYMKKAYGEELKKQMYEKDVRNENERRKEEEWDMFHERRIERDYANVFLLLIMGLGKWFVE